MIFYDLNIFKYLNYMVFENVYEAEYAIQELIKNDYNSSAHFEYEKCHRFKRLKLNLITYNPIHKIPFLLFSIFRTDQNKLEIITEMYEYVYTLKTTTKEKDSQYISYTIEWYCDKTKEKVKTSFHGENIEQVLLKFNHDKKKTIYSMELNL